MSDNNKPSKLGNFAKSAKTMSENVKDSKASQVFSSGINIVKNFASDNIDKAKESYNTLSENHKHAKLINDTFNQACTKFIGYTDNIPSITGIFNFEEKSIYTMSITGLKANMRIINNDSQNYVIEHIEPKTIIYTLSNEPELTCQLYKIFVSVYNETSYNLTNQTQNIIINGDGNNVDAKQNVELLQSKLDEMARIIDNCKPIEKVKFKKAFKSLSEAAKDNKITKYVLETFMSIIEKSKDLLALAASIATILSIAL